MYLVNSRCTTLKSLTWSSCRPNHNHLHAGQALYQRNKLAWFWKQSRLKTEMNTWRTIHILRIYIKHMIKDSWCIKFPFKSPIHSPKIHAHPKHVIILDFLSSVDTSKWISVYSQSAGLYFHIYLGVHFFSPEAVGKCITAMCFASSLSIFISEVWYSLKLSINN